MRRKVLKNYVNTACGIALGWRLRVGGLDRLVEVESGLLRIDLKDGTTEVNGEAIDPPLPIGLEIRDWVAERARADGIELEALELAELDVEFAPSEQMMTAGDIRLIDLSCTCIIRTDETEYTACAASRLWWHRRASPAEPA